MQEVLEYIVKNIVRNKDAVSIETNNHGKNTTYIVTLDSKDLGSVIGRQGVIANSIRNIVQALDKNHGHVNIKFNGNK